MTQIGSKLTTTPKIWVKRPFRLNIIVPTHKRLDTTHWLLYTATATSGQSHLTEDRTAAADGRFSRIRQVAPMCPTMWARWRHLANTIECVLPSAHPSPQPNGKSTGSAVPWASPSPQSKRHHDRFSFAQVTAE